MTFILRTVKYFAPASNMQSFFRKFNFILSALTLGFFITLCSADPAATQTLTDNPEVKNFIDTLVEQQHFDRYDLTHLFSQVKILPEILEIANKPYGAAKPWYLFRDYFINPTHLSKGVEFWQKHSAILNAVAKEYGVPVSILVGIIGVETRYGDFKGNYRVIDTLSTLAFAYPRRANYFKRELTEYLLLTRERELDPLQLYGSYDGGMGLPQFMPSSYRFYAVDYDHKGHIDLTRNETDAIASIANYFKKNHWKKGEPIAVPATVSGDKYQALITTKIKKPSMKLSEFVAAGVIPQQPVAGDPPAMLIKLELADNREEYWLGFQNFYVISRYNHSVFYAMAVYQLGKILQERVAKQ